MSYLVNGSNRIYYRSENMTDENKEVIVFLHTNITTHRVFEDIIPFFRNDFRILSYDLRGFGQSDLGEESLTFDVYLEDLYLLIEHLNLSNIHFIGVGFGGLIALYFSQKYKEIAQSLILISIPCNPPHTIHEIREHRKRISHYGSYIPINYILNVATVLQDNQKQYQYLIQTMKQLSPVTYYKIMDLSVSAEPIPAILANSLPTLVLDGEKDVLFPSHYLRLHISDKENYQFQTIPNSSSITIMDNPQYSAETITSFIKGQRKNILIGDEFVQSMFLNIQTYSFGLYKQGLKRLNSNHVLYVELLTHFKVSINKNEKVLGWNQRYAKELLIFLVFNSSTTREKICEVFWPEIPLQQSKKNLRVYLAHLKKMLHVENEKDCFLIIDRENVYLRNFHCDAIHVIDNLRLVLLNQEEATNIKRAEEILLLFSRNFFNLLYDNWYMNICIEIEEQLLEMILWMVKWYENNNCINKAIKKLLALHSYIGENEIIYNQLMQLYIKINDTHHFEETKKKYEQFIN